MEKFKSELSNQTERIVHYNLITSHQCSRTGATTSEINELIRFLEENQLKTVQFDSRENDLIIRVYDKSLETPEDYKKRLTELVKRAEVEQITFNSVLDKIKHKLLDL